MKKQFTIFLILTFMLDLTPINYSSAQDLSDKLSGKILLQVEGVGQAWYIDPETKKRAFLGRPADAFKIMRELGLGISEDSYNSFNGYAPNKLSGKILLRVEANGEAYYVFPDDLKMHYLGKPADAFDVMREKGLGITDKDLNKVPVFEKYKEQVEENTEAINEINQDVSNQQEKIDELEEKITDLEEIINDPEPNPEPSPEPDPSPGPTPDQEPTPEPEPGPEPEPELSCVVNFNLNSSPTNEAYSNTEDIVLGTLEITSNTDATIQEISDRGNEDFVLVGNGLEDKEVLNIELRDKNTGTFYEISETFDTDGWKLSLTNTIPLSDGETKELDLRIDLAGYDDENTIDNKDTVMAKIKSSAFNIISSESSEITNITPALIESSVVTAITPSLTWETINLSAKTVVPSDSEISIYKAELNSRAAKRLYSVRLDIDDTCYDGFESSNFISISALINGQVAKILNNDKIQNPGTAEAYIEFGSFAVGSRELNDGVNYFKVKANFADTFASNSCFSLEIADQSSYTVARDVNNNPLYGIVENVGQDSKVITLDAE